MNHSGHQNDTQDIHPSNVSACMPAAYGQRGCHTPAGLTGTAKRRIPGPHRLMPNVTAILLACILVEAPRVGAQPNEKVQQWLPLGESFRSGGISQTSHAGVFDLQLDSQGRPWILWHSELSEQQYEVRISRLDGNGWSLVGPGGLVTREPSRGFAALAIDANNQPHVAYVNGSGCLTYMTLHHGRWAAQVLESGFVDRKPWAFAIALDRQETPQVAWITNSRNGTDCRLHSAERRNGVWRRLGYGANEWVASSSYPNNVLLAPHIAVDRKNCTHLTWLYEGPVPQDGLGRAVLPQDWHNGIGHLVCRDGHWLDSLGCY